jgi:hypothetical protein
MNSHGVATISKNVSGRITVSFPYDPQLVVKVKTVDGRKWYNDEKYCSFPNTDGILEKMKHATESLGENKYAQTREGKNLLCYRTNR